MYFAEGSIIADSHEAAKGLMVITSGYVNVELPMDSEEADEENREEHGKTLLFVFGRGCVKPAMFWVSCVQCLMMAWLAMSSDSVGGNSVVGDERWTGSFGVNVDLVARSHCSVAIIAKQDILVMPSVHFALQRESVLSGSGFVRV